MYTPKAFVGSDPQAVESIIKENSFATLILHSKEIFEVTHVPLLYRKNKLVGHVANANPVAKLIKKNPECLAIFHGPHCYVSPSWYESDSVPTWNYISVHVYGRPKVFENQNELIELLTDLTQEHESTQGKPWKFDPTTEDKKILLKMITGFEIEIDRIESKFKLNQNKTEEDRAGVVKALEGQPSENNLAIANWIKNLTLIKNPGE